MIRGVDESCRGGTGFVGSGGGWRSGTRLVAIPVQPAARLPRRGDRRGLHGQRTVAALRSAAGRRTRTNLRLHRGLGGHRRGVAGRSVDQPLAVTAGHRRRTRGVPQGGHRHHVGVRRRRDRLDAAQTRDRPGLSDHRPARGGRCSRGALPRPPSGVGGPPAPRPVHDPGAGGRQSPLRHRSGAVHDHRRGGGLRGRRRLRAGASAAEHPAHRGAHPDPDPRRRHRCTGRAERDGLRCGGVDGHRPAGFALRPGSVVAVGETRRGSDGGTRCARRPDHGWRSNRCPGCR